MNSRQRRAEERLTKRKVASLPMTHKQRVAFRAMLASVIRTHENKVKKSRKKKMKDQAGFRTWVGKGKQVSSS